jgi:hypothetical protein
MPHTSTGNALIPLTLNVEALEPNHKQIQLRVFKERRDTVLAELRTVAGVPKLVRELRADNVYRLVVPDGEVLQQGKDGLFRGVIYDNKGKIAQHAKFEKVVPNLTRVASAVGAQIMLVSIAMQLNRIEAAIAEISEELHDDRMGQILAGIQLYEQAMLMTVPSRREHALQNAIQSLVEGLVKTRFELRRSINKLPDPTNPFWSKDNLWGSKSSKAAKKLQLAEEALIMSMRGASVLAECYAVMDEPHVGVAAFSRCLNDVASCGIETAAEKARIVEVKDSRALPEGPWLQFAEAHRHFVQHAAGAPCGTSYADHGCLTLEFTKNELLEET